MLASWPGWTRRDSLFLEGVAALVVVTAVACFAGMLVRCFRAFSFFLSAGP